MFYFFDANVQIFKEKIGRNILQEFFCFVLLSQMTISKSLFIVGFYCSIRQDKVNVIFERKLAYFLCLTAFQKLKREVLGTDCFVIVASIIVKFSFTL